MRKRSTYRPRVQLANPFLAARNGATKLTQCELNAIIPPVKAAFIQLLRGLGRDDDWCILAGALSVAANIERLGVVKGLKGQLDAADRALTAIEVRASESGEWRSPTLYSEEIYALDALLFVHTYQLKQLSFSEYRRALDTAEAQHRTKGVQVEKLSALVEECVK